jgi:hypothetical protein
MSTLYIIVEAIVLILQANNYYDYSSVYFLVLIFSNNYYIIFMLHLFKAYDAKEAKYKKDDIRDRLAKSGN